MLVSTVTTKGQVTIPALIRSMAGIKAADKIFFKALEGKILLERVPSLDSLYGSLFNSKVKPLSVEEMNELSKEMFSGK